MTKKHAIVQTMGTPCELCGGTEWVCECDHDRIVDAQAARITAMQLEMARATITTRLMTDRIAELEALASRAAEWAAGYPLGGGHDEVAAADIYALYQEATDET